MSFKFGLVELFGFKIIFIEFRYLIEKFDPEDKLLILLILNVIVKCLCFFITDMIRIIIISFSFYSMNKLVLIKYL